MNPDSTMADREVETEGDDWENTWANPERWPDTQLHKRTTAQQHKKWLFAAVAAGDARFIRRLLHIGMSAHRSQQGYTLLHIASFMSDVPMVQALCEYGADPHSTGNDWTPIQITLNHGLGNLDIASMMLRYSGLRYAQEMIREMEQDKKGAVEERDTAHGSEGQTGDQCLFNMLPRLTLGETGVTRVLRVGHRTRLKGGVDTSILGTMGDGEHAFAECIMEELHYWHRVSARQ